MPLTMHTAPAASPVLVTGATGFIGAHVVQRLNNNGVPVIALSRSTPQHTLAVSRQTRSIQCDLLDARDVESLVRTHRPTTCIHAAWDVAHPEYLDSHANQKWVQASLHLARCLLEHGCRWLGVCGTHIEPVRNAPPKNRYAGAKATLRHRLCELVGDRMTICWWRIFQPYGEGERADRFVPSLLQALTSGQRLLVRQPQARRDFIHVSDVASAMTASHSRELGGVLDVGAGRLHAIRDVAIKAARCLDAEHLLDFAPANDERDANVPADTSLLGGLAAWQPEIDLDVGLEQLSRAYSLPLRATA